MDNCVKRCDNYRDLYYLLYCFARDEWSGSHRAFYTTGINSFESYIFTYSKSVVERITVQNRSGGGLSPEEEMQLDVFCYGISYMYEKWTFRQYTLDPDAAADALYALMPETLKHYWFLPEVGQRTDKESVPV